MKTIWPHEARLLTGTYTIRLTHFTCCHNTSNWSTFFPTETAVEFCSPSYFWNQYNTNINIQSWEWKREN